MQYQWAEDDFELPSGVCRLGLSEPVCGRKYVMYHGTTSKAARDILASGFQQSAGGMLGRGVYLSRDLQKASRYPIGHPESDKVVIKVVVDVGKVIAINYQGHPRLMNWHDPTYGEVHDTAWVPPRCGMVKSGLKEDCVWDPDRIQVIKIINPCPVQASGACVPEATRPHQHSLFSVGMAINDTDTNMQFQWAEDDFDLPYGVCRLGLSAPVSGNAYVMYHGTTRQNARDILASGFRQSAGGMLGPGVYLSRDLQKASRYPIGHPESDKVAIKVVVNVGKVIAINYQGHPRQKTWHDSRYGEVYDTAWVPPNCGMVRSGLEEDCVWDPHRIQVIGTIEPRPVQGFCGCGAQGYMCDTDTNMQFQWIEDVFDLASGVCRLGLSAPVSGKSYVMYHGTTSKAARDILASGFHQSADGMLGRGVYVSRDLQKASRYPIGHPEFDKVVIRVVVSVGKVIAINRQGHPRQKTWHDSRYGEVYDTAWVPPNCGMVRSGLEEDCVWDPDRIQVIGTIEPSPIQSIVRTFLQIFNDTDTNMQYQWAEDDFELPSGVCQLGLSEPVSGRKYVMYHGTTSKAARGILASGFQQSAGGMLGPGVYLSRDLQKASRYPIGHPESDRVVIKVKVNVGKVIAINYQGHPRQKTWHDSRHGEVYDTAWVPPNCGMVKSGLEEDCVWDPDRIQIICTIKPRPVQDFFGGCGAHNYM
ncbi:LOW QUALITY PROTEIN: grass carp reovirus (GCRV)-induced gene 2e [Enoplosus armatus]|uniref:LOW QUALITY PROTEIN: grass carp reovirus (GCRV)-induced gene 2e n=1 Tax=Enoplosus armatus TaxID=215367 RepID=UPI0039910DB7